MNSLPTPIRIIEVVFPLNGETMIKQTVIIESTFNTINIVHHILNLLILESLMILNYCKFEKMVRTPSNGARVGINR